MKKSKFVFIMIVCKHICICVLYMMCNYIYICIYVSLSLCVSLSLSLSLSFVRVRERCALSAYGRLFWSAKMILRDFLPLMTEVLRDIMFQSHGNLGRSIVCMGACRVSMSYRQYYGPQGSCSGCTYD